MGWTRLRWTSASTAPVSLWYALGLYLQDKLLMGMNRLINVYATGITISPPLLLQSS